ncbi:PQQ-dependent sugar dehydrogenase [Catenovulum adriaticum]|uniref:PQQ-dependent sugar dehydrogenase n=1 Tax=Catenovulum adriaticum TaxID=2984846 RepID=A0ABY7AQX1_9ALTE|nr:PQQ-dependent sugar dehydrogenase [Catenovulum sp. TS8]WAJ71939.1 PQQ-dependent sugar dehydrogenase [Catenovulum sp. TS8]
MKVNIPLLTKVVLLTLGFTVLHTSTKAFAIDNVDKAEGKIDLVAQGKQAFIDKGCAECHSTKENDPSFKSGPNLYGLFQVPAKLHRVKLKDGGIVKVEADNIYFNKSLNSPTEDLALQTTGPETGSAYLPIMPKINLHGTERVALLAYLKTLNSADKSGPKQVWKSQNMQSSKKQSPYDNQLWVGKDATFARGHLADVSTRTIHVGLPNQINYSFDTQNFSVKKIWSNVFLDVTKERMDRGVGLNKLAEGAVDWQVETLLVPLTSALQPVDLSFKNWPTFVNPWQDLEKYRKSREKSDYARPYLDDVAQAKGKFLGIDHSNKQLPAMRYQVEGRVYQQTIDINDNGLVTYVLRIDGSKRDSRQDNTQDVSFLINTNDNRVVELSHGKIEQGIWTIPRQQTSNVTISLLPNKLPKPVVVESTIHEFSHGVQDVVKERDLKATLPAGYKAESIMAPKDRFGRAQLFEPLGLDFAQDGTAVVGSRTAGIWKIKNNKWHFFAEGFQDLLGLHVEDKHGNQLVVAHKPELTRVIDTNKDGVADEYRTINDDWRFAGNYCEYVHGPVPDGQGNYFLNLNLAHGGDKTGGTAMGTFGGYDGWLVRITKDGTFQPWASGLRSPAGLGKGPNNMLLYTDNQGSYVGTSKLHIVEKNDYFGYPASLKDDERYRQKNIDWQEVNQQAKLANIYFPHNIVANSPGNPTYDTTAGKFGPFAGQILVGDQTKSNISRVTLEQVEGQWQGAVMPFINNLRSGAMRLVFAPDNSLWVGQTGRGWHSSGGNYEALQRIVWDGKTTPFEIHTVNLIENGFSVSFTDLLQQKTVSAKDIEVTSWRYKDTEIYGSPRYGITQHAVTQLTQSEKSVEFKLAAMKPGLIYEIKLHNIKAKSGTEASNNSAYYTLHKLKQ